jgi:RimJ/RimL family protein N-acetyltransferase
MTYTKRLPQKISEEDIELIKIIPDKDDKQLEELLLVYKRNRKHLYFWHHEQKELLFSTTDDIKKYIKKGRVSFYMLYFSGKIIGSIELGPLYTEENLKYRNLAYWIDEEYTRKGIIYKSLLLIEEILFKQELDGLSVKTDTENKPAIHLIQKLNYKFESMGMLLSMSGETTLKFFSYKKNKSKANKREAQERNEKQLN